MKDTKANSIFDVRDKKYTETIKEISVVSTKIISIDCGGIKNKIYKKTSNIPRKANVRTLLLINIVQ